MEMTAQTTEALDRWLFRAGYVSEWVRMLADPETLDPPAAAPVDEPPPRGAFGLLPRPVDFSRAMLAGVVGTMLSDALDVIETSVARRKFETNRQPSANTALPAEFIGEGMGIRYGRGVRRAVQYARFIHPRLPGPPVLRGLCYGALEAVASPRLTGDLLRGRWRSAQEAEELALEVGRHLAFGATVGMVYGMLEEREIEGGPVEGGGVREEG
jgi:hypothetical protein